MVGKGHCGSGKHRHACDEEVSENTGELSFDTVTPKTVLYLSFLTEKKSHKFSFSTIARIRNF